MNKINILVFGDSITYGAWDKEKGGWVNRLRLAYENSNDNYTIFNLGISGEVTEETKNRFDFECHTRYKKDAKNIIVFAIGINDSQDNCKKDRTPIETFKKNIIDLINNAKRYTDNILFIGLTQVDETKVVPIPWNTDICYYNKKIKLYDETIHNVCLSHKVNYLHVFNLLSLSELSDGLHPNKIGHQKLCDAIKTKIDQFI